MNLREIIAGMGPDPTARMLQSDVNRGVLPGTRTPGSESYSPAELAEIDRYAWGQQAGIGGAPVAAGYELVKALGGAPGISGLSGKLFGKTGEDFFKEDKTTSPASLSNILAYIQGATDPVAAAPVAARPDYGLRGAQISAQPERGGSIRSLLAAVLAGGR